METETHEYTNNDANVPANQCKLDVWARADDGNRKVHASSQLTTVVYNFHESLVCLYFILSEND